MKDLLEDDQPRLSPLEGCKAILTALNRGDSDLCAIIEENARRGPAGLYVNLALKRNKRNKDKCRALIQACKWLKAQGVVIRLNFGVAPLPTGDLPHWDVNGQAAPKRMPFSKPLHKSRRGCTFERVLEPA